jgi:hypothetical protein
MKNFMRDAIGALMVVLAICHWCPDGCSSYKLHGHISITS